MFRDATLPFAVRHFLLRSYRALGSSCSLRHAMLFGKMRGAATYVCVEPELRRRCLRCQSSWT